MNKNIHGLLFDKDGTLFDFESSWGPWYADLLQDLAGDETLAAQLAAAVHFNLSTGRFGGESILIHGTADDFLDIVLPLLPHWNRDHLSEHVLQQSEHVAQIPVLPLAPLFDGLITTGLKLGIATNDNEIPAIVQLKTAGIHDSFAFIAGCDSGFGAKPGNGMQNEFCAATGLNPATVAMVGDSAHDLVSGRNAGMQTIAVLTGIATHAELAPLADVVLRDIGEIPGWLAG